MRNDLLIDTGFLYALFDEGDLYHEAANQVRQFEVGLPLVPDIVLVEATFLAARDGQTWGVINFLSIFEQQNFELVSITMADVVRAREIMQRYMSRQLDFVDCCIMALAERLDICRICTIDPLDFQIFKPTHCQALETLPAQLKRR